MSNEIAKTEATELATSTPGFAFDGPTGFEDVDKDCVTIPFLKMAQASTDEAKKGSPSYIKGLEPGMFFCPATRKVYGEKVGLAIVKFYRQYVIYESREPDSRFMGTMDAEQFRTVIEPTATRERSFHLDSEGHRYVDTRNFIVFVSEHWNDGPMLLSLSSTGIAPSKKWLTQAQNVRSDDGRLAPIWANVWELETGYMDNPQGSYYQISRISRMGYIPAGRKNLILASFNDFRDIKSDVIESSHEKDEKPAGNDAFAETAGKVMEAQTGRNFPKATESGDQPEIF